MLKNTKTRENVKSVLTNATTPLSAYNIFEMLKEKNITLSSIYRTLDAFYKHNIISKETSHDGVSTYSIIRENHKHYLECKKCHNITTLDYCPYHKTNEQIKIKTGFVVDEHNVVIYGLCSKCTNDNIDI